MPLIKKVTVTLNLVVSRSKYCNINDYLTFEIHLLKVDQKLMIVERKIHFCRFTFFSEKGFNGLSQLDDEA